MLILIMGILIYTWDLWSFMDSKNRSNGYRAWIIELEYELENYFNHSWEVIFLWSFFFIAFEEKQNFSSICFRFSAIPIWQTKRTFI